MVYFFSKKILQSIRAGYSSLFFVKNLPFRVFERVKRIRHNKDARLPLQDFSISGIDAAKKVNTIWSELAVPPGFDPYLPASGQGFWKENADNVDLDGLFYRKLKILSSVPFDISIINEERLKKFRDLSRELPSEITRQYILIDWHKDFGSGYKWDPSEFFLDVKVAPTAGAEIKIPRELSRFQHIGVLASAPLEKAGTEFTLEVLDWIAANPVGYGVNWGCTMDVALRAVNWIWGLRFFEPVMIKYPGALQTILASLYHHGKHIEKNLEYYKVNTGNHYLSNIAGLIYIGAAFPEFPESDHWLLFGLQELLSEMKREVYSDGYSHEGSTHYHRLVAELFVSSAAISERIPLARRKRLQLKKTAGFSIYPRLSSSIKSAINLTTEGQLLPDGFYEKLYKMGELTATLTKPNNLVPQFGDNDSARAHKLVPVKNEEFRDHRHLPATINELLGITGNEDAMVSYESKLVAGGIELNSFAQLKRSSAAGNRSVHFKKAGIVVIDQPGIFLAVTCGTNGQNGRGGHNHNDKLSFELAINGQDIIVDGGCPVYTADADTRNQFRSTSAHNTIMLDSMEQDEWPGGVGGLFSLPEHSFPSIKLVNENTIVGEHFGYAAPHKRTFIIEEKKITIRDVLDSVKPKISHLNFHPSVNCEIEDSDNGKLTCLLKHSSGTSIRLHINGVAEPVIKPGFYSVGYGQRISTTRLEIQMLHSEATIEFNW